MTPSPARSSIRPEHTTRRTSSLVSVALAVALLNGGCTGARSTADGTADDATSAGSSTTTEPSTTTQQSTTNNEPVAGSAQQPARWQLDWVVAVLNDGGRFDETEVRQRFSPVFLAEVPADQLNAFTPQIFSFAEPPYIIERFDPAASGLVAEAVLLGADGRRLNAQIAVEAIAPYLIEGLGLAPTELEFPSPITIDAIGQRLAAMGPQSSVGVYDVTAGQCDAVLEIRTDNPIVLGSAFKLWVLAALANEVDAGRASWDEVVAVTDELRSTPDGEIYELETGSEVTLQRLAEAMISISDNTATDMLLDRLGRASVEATMDRIGVDDPAANVPMLSTGNLFALKFVATEPNSADYRTLDDVGRRSLLEELDGAELPWVSGELSLEDLAASTNAEGVGLNEPRDLDIEWFATAGGLCRTLVHLDELAAQPGLEPVASILETNPGEGIPFDRERWPTIRFKGGSEPGVLTGAWWFEGSDGERYVVAGGVANPDLGLDELDAVLTLASAIELVN